MSLRVLQDRASISAARAELDHKGLSGLESAPRRLLNRLKRGSSIAVGDWIKSWDVLNTVSLLQLQLDRSAPILDIGAFSSEALVALWRAGFTDLAGVDLNPALLKMPLADRIRFRIADFRQTDFPSASFSAVTAISVIEHGFDGPALLAEVSRLLGPGGLFVSSFDYWPEKIDTSGVRLFGMSWHIFSALEVRKFIQEAETYGLEPLGELAFGAQMRPVKFAGREYTFGWLALRKTKRP
jgi:SAM-dependent methyltransferase